MTSLDLKDAYFSLPIDKRFRKYLRFHWRNKVYQFQCLCFGLSSAPYYFTKAMKPVFAQLRREGVACSYYIDDSLYFDRDCSALELKTDRARCLLESLGFSVNTKKSVVKPSKVITHLGFLIDTECMRLSLPEDKVSRIVRATSDLLSRHSVTIRQLASVIGLLVSSMLAVRFGQLHYRGLELEKVEGLKCHGSYDSVITLGDLAKRDLTWWHGCVLSHNGRSFDDVLSIGEYQDDMFTDASSSGWGAVLYRNGTELQRCGGRWSSDEACYHINYLELKAIHLALMAFVSELSATVLIHSDNQTAISYVNKYGGCPSPLLNELSHDLWTWCIDKQIDIRAVHVPGSCNVDADYLSRQFNDNIEWSLRAEIFDQLVDRMGCPSIDLFASRLNAKLPRFYSWHPEPGCEAVNAFNCSWSHFWGYAFPPFNLIGRVLYKIVQDKACVLLIFPYWPSQPWFPLLSRLLFSKPFVLPSSVDLLSCPGRPELRHPLLPSMQLVAGVLWLRDSRMQGYPRNALKSYWQVGNHQQLGPIPAPSDSGLTFVTPQGLTQAIHL